MKYRAVIFDLFGTLVDEYPPDDYHRELSQMAAVLGLPADEFARRWHASTPERNVGGFASLEANLRLICNALRAPVEPARLAAAARLRIDGERSHLIPRADAEETLGALKARGYKTGLVSNTFGHVPGLWREIPLAALVDAPIFSCEVGLEKPDRRIYELVCAHLGVGPGQCLYVGDGGSDELTGAAQAGMHPVRICVPYEDWGANGYAQNWEGRRVAALREVLGLLD